MTSNRDNELLSYFPRKGKSRLDSGDILGIEDESLTHPDNNWDSFDKYEAEEDTGHIALPWESEEAAELEDELASKEEKEDKP
ncbi:MAG: hypothetical protein NTW48_06305, partial [Chloroflexi bacterium]|nr:hypothetical protein [Chloroflexota bacterium]